MALLNLTRSFDQLLTTEANLTAGMMNESLSEQEKQYSGVLDAVSTVARLRSRDSACWNVSMRETQDRTESTFLGTAAELGNAV